MNKINNLARILCLIGITLLSFVTLNANENKVLLLDASGSMGGLGLGNENYYYKIREQIGHFLTKPENSNVTVVPFTNKVMGAYKGDEFLNRGYSLQKGNTNILVAIDYLPKVMKTDSINTIILITDGKQNTGSTMASVASVLNGIKASNKDNHYYLLALSPELKVCKLASIFDGKNNFTMLNSLDEVCNVTNDITISDTITANKDSVTQDAISMSQADKPTKSSFIKNYWWLLLVTIIVFLSIVLFKSKNKWRNRTLKETYGENLYTIHESNTHIDKGPVYHKRELTISEAIKGIGQINKELTKGLDVTNPKDLNEYNRRLASLPENVRHKIEQLNKKDYNIPRKGGNWDGKPGYSSFYPNDEVMPKNSDKNYNPENKPLKQYMKDKCGVDHIEYKDQEPVFRPLAAEYHKMKSSQELLSNRKKYQNEAKKILKNKWQLNSTKEVDQELGRRHLTIHEEPDGEGFSLVDYLIHESFSHTGGVNHAQTCMAGGSPLTDMDVKQSLEILRRK